MKRDSDSLYIPTYTIIVLLMMAELYRFSHPAIIALLGGAEAAASAPIQAINAVFFKFDRAGILRTQYGIKAIIAGAIWVSTSVKHGRRSDLSVRQIVLIIAVSAVLFFFPVLGPWPHLVLTVPGFIGLFTGFSMLGRTLGSEEQKHNDLKETFQQCDRKVETGRSINLKTEYYYQGRRHTGYINLVSPEAGIGCYGVPGTGKSYSVINSVIESEIAHGFAMYVYDYKYPTLTRFTYNEYLRNRSVYVKKYGVEPQFCVINFNDPRQSMRCNPMRREYLSTQQACTEFADVLMDNADKTQRGNDNFFKDSAKVFIKCAARLLAKHHGGVYCTFAHLVELLGRNYKAVLAIMEKDEELEIMSQPFRDADKPESQGQLQGQIASARIPMLRFPAASLYWTLTGDDFSLDLNNPDAPKILCIGNDPDLQSTLSTSIALYTMRLFKVLNHPETKDGKPVIPCGVIIDELPTIYVKDLNTIIDTARSNLVCVCYTCQDVSQLKAEYKELAKIIHQTVGNIVCARVSGETAKAMSEAFGKEDRRQESETSGENESVSTSWQQRELLPQSRLETLSNGTFCGKVADLPGAEIEQKFFCGKIIIDNEERARKARAARPIPNFGAKYFDDEGVKAEFMKDPDRNTIRYMAERMHVREMDAYHVNHHNVPRDMYLCTKACIRKYRSLDGKGRKAMIQEAVKARQDAAVEAILKANYDRIRDEVSSIFDDYGINERLYGMTAGGKDGGGRDRDDDQPGFVTS